MRFREKVSGGCDEKCREEFRERVLPQHLLETIAGRLEALHAQNISGLVIDLTDNGGGDDWVRDVLRMMSARPLTCPGVANVREPAAVVRLDTELRAVVEIPRPAAIRAMSAGT